MGLQTMQEKNAYLKDVPSLDNGVKTLFGMPRCPNIDQLNADIAFLGVPYDYGSPVWVQPGTRFGPNGMRQARCAYNYGDLHELKEACGWYNIDTNTIELEGITMADVGDVFIEPWEASKNFDRMTDATRKILSKGAMPLSIGGDHTVTYPLIRGFDKFSSLDIVHIDAHLDFEDPKERIDNTTPLKRASELPFVRNITQIGTRPPYPLRSMRALAEAKKYGEKLVTVQNFRKHGIQSLMDAIPEAENIYITFDIDALDPSIAMGTSTPMPNGFLFQEAIDIIETITKKGNVVGFDLVEFSPSHDVSNVTSRTCADLLLYALSSIFRNKRR